MAATTDPRTLDILVNRLRGTFPQAPVEALHTALENTDNDLNSAVQYLITFDGYEPISSSAAYAGRGNTREVTPNDSHQERASSLDSNHYQSVNSMDQGTIEETAYDEADDGMPPAVMQQSPDRNAVLPSKHHDPTFVAPVAAARMHPNPKQQNQTLYTPHQYHSNQYMGPPQYQNLHHSRQPGYHPPPPANGQQQTMNQYKQTHGQQPYPPNTTPSNRSTSRTGPAPAAPKQASKQVAKGPPSNTNAKNVSKAPASGGHQPPTLQLPKPRSAADRQAGEKISLCDDDAVNKALELAGTKNKVLLILPSPKAVRTAYENIGTLKLKPTTVTLFYSLNHLSVGKDKPSICCTSALDVALTLHQRNGGTSPFKDFSNVILSLRGFDSISLEAQVLLAMIRKDNMQKVFEYLYICTDKVNANSVHNYLFGKDSSGKPEINESMTMDNLATMLSLLCCADGLALWTSLELLDMYKQATALAPLKDLGLLTEQGHPTPFGQLVAFFSRATESGVEVGCAAAVLASLGLPVIGAAVAISYDGNLEDIYQRTRALLELPTNMETGVFHNFFEATKNNLQITKPKSEQVLKDLEENEYVFRCVTNAFLDQKLMSSQKVALLSVLPCLRPAVLIGEDMGHEITNFFLPTADGHRVMSIGSQDIGDLLSARWHINFCIESYIKTLRNDPNDNALIAATKERLRDIEQVVCDSSFDRSPMLPRANDASFKFTQDITLFSDSIGKAQKQFYNVSQGNAPNHKTK